MMASRRARWLPVSALLCLVLAGVARDAAAAQLKSLQSGTVTVSGVPLVVILPTAVDMTKAFVVFGAAESTGDPVDGQVSGQLTSPTAVTFQQDGGVASVTVKYYVAEFSSGVSVQRGSVNNSSGNVFDVTLGSAVTTARSFPLISYRSDGVNFNCNDFVRAKLTSGSNLRLSSDVSCGPVASSTVEWQVVQYQDANVRSGDLTFAATDLSRTAALAPAVDPAKSWLIYSYETSPASIPDIGQYLVRGLLTNSTQLTFDRSNRGTVGLTLTWYLVEFTDASTVQSGSRAFLTAETVTDVTLPLPAPPGTSIALGGGDYQRGGRSSYAANDVVGTAWFNFDLTASNNLRISRGAGGLAPADVGWFVVTFATGGCSALATTADPIYQGYLVTAPTSCEYGFGYPGGGGVHEFFDLAEDPGRAYDLGGGDVPGRQPSLWSDELLGVGGTNYQSGRNLTGSRNHLLEATGTRVRIRQDAFFQDVTSGPILGGVKGAGDYTIYPSGRMALHWVRRYTNVATFNYTGQQLQTVTHFEPAGPLNTWLTYSDAGLMPPTRTVPPNHAFLLSQIEQPGARTDVLTILSKDWAAEANTSQSSSANLFIENTWNSAAGSIVPGRAPDIWDFLFYLKPTNLANHNDTAVIWRSADYRSPAALTTSTGSRWASASENTSAAGDWFNEAEAVYPLDFDPALGLDFDIGGAPTGPRYKPFFKIRQWRSLVDAPVVSLEGTPLTKNVDYRADVKPFSRAHWASTLAWHCTMQSATACDSARLDVGAGVANSTTGTTATPGRYGNGLLFSADNDQVDAGATDFNPSIGAVDFWYQPRYASGNNTRYILWYWQAGNNPDYHCFLLEKTAGNALTFSVRTNYGDRSCTTADGNSASFSASAALAGSFAWRAYDWVHLKVSWNSAAAAGSRKLRIVMNGVEMAASAAFVAPAGSATPTFGGCSGANCPGGAAGNPNGILDEVHLYGGLESGAYDTNSSFGFAGLTSDPGEYLADTTKNWPLGLTPVSATRAGSYLYFGSDSQFRGLNVSLQTKGIWQTTPGALVWEYWNGTQWASLTVGDTTSGFTSNGTVYWTSDPATWSPYSVNGGPDLYYVRLHLGAGALSYRTLPIERIVKTDILLFQYCNDITAPLQTFQFDVPPATAVELMSFEARGALSAVELSWQTGSELDNLGFHLHRSTSETGPWTRITSSLIPGLGWSPMGASYSYVDRGLVPGRPYYYRLEDVDTHALSTFHGPVSAVPLPADASPPPVPPSTGGKKASDAPATTCPAWVLTAYAGAAPVADPSTIRCTRHGQPEAVSVDVTRSAQDATVELRTGGFYAVRDASGAVRAFVPGFDFPSEPTAAALPLRRVLVDAPVGRRARIASVEALDWTTYAGLVPAALGRPEMVVAPDGTVRGTHRPLAREARRAGLRLSPAAHLAGVSFLGETKAVAVELSPLRVDPRRGALLLARRLLVRVAFTGFEAGENGRGFRGRRPPAHGGQDAPPGGGPAASAETLARLFTTARGLHAVTFESLFPADRGPITVSSLRLQRAGEPVPLHVEPAGPSFGPGGVLYFYAPDTAASTDYTGEVAYELLLAAGGVLMTARSAAPGDTVVAGPATSVASFERNLLYEPGLLDAADLWQWDAMITGAARTLPFTLAGVDPSSPGTLLVFLQGASDSGNEVDHHVRVAVNGVDVGETSFAGKVPQTLTTTVPAGLLREGANELTVTNVGDTGVPSLVLLDRFSIEYPRAAAATAGRFEGRWSGAGTATVRVAGLPVVVDVTNPPQWLTGFDRTGSAVRLQAEAGHRYVVAAPEGLLAPRVARPLPTTLRDTTNQADYVLITPQRFRAAAQPLVARRASQGLAVKVATLEEIASAFGGGSPSARAVRDFLEYAYQSWRRPSPRYVLLLGGASQDPRNFTGTSRLSPLPYALERTSFLWTGSDAALAAVNGDDAVPDLALGRLPAHTVAQAEALVAKALDWEDSGQGLDGRAVLVADNPDAGGDFDADVDDIAQSFLAGRDTQVLKLSQLGGATRPAVFDAFNGGASLMSYVGHGAAAVWASEALLTSFDVPSLLAQPRQPLLFTLNCLNGYFLAPSYDSLAEALVKAEGRGAIASVSPSGLSIDGPAHVFHRALMAEVTGGGHARLGDAFLAAQTAYARSGQMPELLRIYVLFGDPGMPIR